MKFAFGLLPEMLDASFHLSRPKKKFDSFLKFFNLSFKVAIDYLLPLKQLGYNCLSLSIILIFCHFLGCHFVIETS